MITQHRRRKTDKQPQRETYLQEMCNRLDEELRLVRAENSRLQALVAKKPIQHEDWCDATGAWGWKTSCDCGATTRPMELAA